MTTENVQELRVAFNTDIHSLATSIIRNHDEGRRIYLACVGSTAVHQAMKAVASVNAKSDGQVAVTPFFDEVRTIDRETKRPIVLTALKFWVIFEK